MLALMGIKSFSNIDGAANINPASIFIRDAINATNIFTVHKLIFRFVE